VHYSLAVAKVPEIRGFYELNGGKNFHQFTTAATGKSNTQWTIWNRLVIEWGPRDWLSLSLDLRLNKAWTYLGNETNNFYFIQEANFQITEPFSVTVGHSNQGPTVKANGTDSNIAILSDTGSKFYMGLNYQL
jgi:hypothetical protein